MELFSAAADSRSQSSQPSQKKVLKKLHRKQELFLKAEPECGVQFVSTSSRFVFVGNGGLKNGLSRDLLTALLHSGNHSEGLLQVHLYPGKDYSFCTFKEVENATVTVAALNGVCVQDVCKRYNMQHLLSPVLSSGPPLHLYLSFVDRLPSDSALTTAPSGLCQAANQLPPGLILIPDFISCEEEGRFMDFFVISEDKMTKFVANEDAAAVPQEMLKHRSVKHYGYEFLYGSNSVDPEHPLPGGLPAICTTLLERILEAGLVAHPPDQLTVNQYLPGSGIPPHVDTHSAFEDGIISITLGSHTVMGLQASRWEKDFCFSSKKELAGDEGRISISVDSRHHWPKI